MPADLRPLLGSSEVDAYLDRLNRRVLDEIERSGEAFLSSAVVNGRFALRACIVNFRTSEADLDTLLAAVRRAGSRALAPPGAA